MKTQLFFSNSGRFACLSIFLLLISSTHLLAQSPCPPTTGLRTSNPSFPGCLPPGGDPFKVLLVLDESASINFGAGFEGDVENAVRGFANTLAASAQTTGELQMGIVEFSSNAAIGVPMKDVKDANFITTVQTYLNGDNTGNSPNYNPNGDTNYEAAFNLVATIPGVDIVFFISDGNPTSGGGQNVWLAAANRVKCAKTYIFGIGLGASVTPLSIQLVSGPDQLGNPLGLQAGADWTIQSFANLPASLVDLANARIDRQAPTLTCPAAIRDNNDKGMCGKTVSFIPTTSDNCGIASVLSTPASGSFFAVGSTTVQFTAKDNVGNTATCSFLVTVSDLEAPEIACPPQITLSCEESLAPATAGAPITLDNCGIGQITNTDQRINGGCPSQFTIQRTWTVGDINGNFSTCVQTINVVDQKAPVLNCPPAITVTCDTTIASTGRTTVLDNCDTTPLLKRADQVTSGDCVYFCAIDRTWTSTDNCGNQSKCVQKITKNALPLLEDALNKDLNGDGRADTLILGVSNSILVIPPGRGICIQQWIPSATTRIPFGLQFEKAFTGADCRPGNNPLTETGKLANPLVVEALKLNLLVRLKPALGTTKLSTLGCNIAPIIINALAPNPDIKELLRVTNAALGNIALQPHLKELLDALKCINLPLDVCK